MSPPASKLYAAWQALNDCIIGARDFIICSLSVIWAGFDRFLNKAPPIEKLVQQNNYPVRPRSVFDEQRLRRARENGRTVEPFIRPSGDTLDSKWWKHTFYNLILVMVVVFIFDYVFFPVMEKIAHLVLGEGADKLWAVIGPMINLLFGACWMLPCFIVLKVTNFFCFGDIESAAHVKHESKNKRKQTPMTMSLAEFISDMIRSLINQTVFLVQASFVGYLPIPYLNYVLMMIHITLLYSLYAFDYRFTRDGLTTHQRIRVIERNWPYFIGFSLLYAVLITWIPHWMVSSGAFAVIFPLAIISAYSAKIPHHDPNRALPQLPIFQFSMIVTDKIQHLLAKLLSPDK